MKNSPLLCTVCCVALAACVHGAAHSFIEAGQPHHVEGKSALSVEVLPPEGDHTHNEFERTARMRAEEPASVGGSGSVSITPRTGSLTMTSAS